MNVGYLIPAAQALFRAFGEVGTRGVLVGGAAVLLHGQDRLTKDLDVRVDKMPPSLPIPFYFRQGSREGRALATFLDPQEKVSIRTDLTCVAAPSMALLQKYSEDCMGIRIASPIYLLADKLRTHGARGYKNDYKAAHDMDDITFLLTALFMAGEKMPTSLMGIFHTTDVESFLAATGRNREEYKWFLAEVGILC